MNLIPALYTRRSMNHRRRTRPPPACRQVVKPIAEDLLPGVIGSAKDQVVPIVTAISIFDEPSRGSNTIA
jgi:hypothetical protein